MPVAAVLSILHRVAGVLLFLAFPVAVYCFDLALRGPDTFIQVRDLLTGSVGARVVCAVVLWALLHHLLAGIRYLLLDIRIGVDRNAAQLGAWFVFWVELVVLFLVLASFFL